MIYSFSDGGHDNKNLSMKVSFRRQGDFLSCMEFVTLITYFNNLYEASRLVFDPQYNRVSLSERRFYSGPKFKSYLDEDDQQYIRSIDYGSLIVELILQYSDYAIDAILAFIAFYNFYFRKRDRRELENLITLIMRGELEKRFPQREMESGEIQPILKGHDAERQFELICESIDSCSATIDKIVLGIERELKKK